MVPTRYSDRALYRLNRSNLNRRRAEHIAEQHRRLGLDEPYDVFDLPIMVQPPQPNIQDFVEHVLNHLQNPPEDDMDMDMVEILALFNAMHHHNH